MDFGVFKHLLNEAEKEAPRPPKRPAQSSTESETENPIPEYILALGRNDRIRDIAENLLASRPVDSGVLWELMFAIETVKPGTYRRGVVAAWSVSRLVLIYGQRTDPVIRLAEFLRFRYAPSIFHTAARRTLLCAFAVCFPCFAGWETFPARLQRWCFIWRYRPA